MRVSHIKDKLSSNQEWKVKKSTSVEIEEATHIHHIASSCSRRDPSFESHSPLFQEEKKKLTSSIMMDPMADLGGPSAGGGGGPKQQDNLSTTREVFDPLAMGANFQRIDRIRSVMGIASGCVAGILGLTGLTGFRK